ncbi:MAG: hypothetical protein NUV73_00995, partial [Candidatus Daviesbacteria bacterium]|nr:hypothetical protein [Candidatus Daviesbacteria bacterium]
MIDEKFIFVAVALILFGDFTYLVYTIKGRVRPNKVTWFLWGLAPLLAFAAQLREGVGLSSLTTFAFGALPLFIFAASFFNRKAYWKVTNFDLMCGALALTGLILWQVTQVGNWAILFGVLADGAAAVPTVIKSYKAPETENYLVYFFNPLGAIITLLTLKTWDFTHYAFPV